MLLVMPDISAAPVGCLQVPAEDWPAIHQSADTFSKPPKGFFHGPFLQQLFAAGRDQKFCRRLVVADGPSV